MGYAYGYTIFAMKEDTIRIFYSPFNNREFVSGHDIKEKLEYKGWTVSMYPAEQVTSIAELYNTIEKDM